MSDEEKGLKPEPEVGTAQPTAEQIALEAARVRKKHFDSMTQPLKNMETTLKKLEIENEEVAKATKQAFKAMMKGIVSSYKNSMKGKKPEEINDASKDAMWEELKQHVKTISFPGDLKKEVNDQINGFKEAFTNPETANYLLQLGNEGKTEFDGVMAEVNAKQTALDKEVKDASAELKKEDKNNQNNEKTEQERAETESNQESKETKKENDKSRRNIFHRLRILRGIDKDEKSGLTRPMVPVLTRMLPKGRGRN